MKTIFQHLKFDFPASIVVFFVALPLCLGIAMASGVSPFAGIVAGIVGGIFVGAASGSSLGVSGPAAGLVVIVINAIADLGGSFEAFLVAIIIAGLIQIAMGFAKLGTIAYFFPNSVIKGMLSAIGLIIILKQIPHAFGYDADYEGDMDFNQSDHENTISELENAWNYLNPAAIIICVISIILLVVWEKYLSKKHKIFTILPGPLAVVIIGIVCNLLFINGLLPFSLSEKQVVNLPVSQGFFDFISQFKTPDFSAFGNPKVYMIGFVIAIVASLETLLCVEATDKLDPNKNITPTNRELKAQGIGNIISGFIGGLPLTQVIVRSSANISFGGKTKLSAIIHGFLLLFAVLLFPKVLNLIPLATLASILIVVGYKLLNPFQFKHIFKIGLNQFIPFTVTIVAIVLTDLLTGIAIGFAFAIFYILKSNYKNSYIYHVNDKTSKIANKIILAEEVSFLNKAMILKRLDSIAPNSNVEINALRSKFIDRDVIEIIQNFQTNAISKNINVKVLGLEKFIKTDKKKNIKAITKDAQEALSPQKALELLINGNLRFINNLRANRNLLQQVNETSDGQHPFAFILSCIDSRISSELIFDQGLGDIFSCRVAGNVLNEDILGSMEFGTKVAGSKVIVVLGHSKCGAIKGACDDVKLGNLTALVNKIKPAIDEEHSTLNIRNSSNEEFVEKVSQINVVQVTKQILIESSIIAEMVKKEEIILIGAMYNVETGEVEFYD